MVEYLLENDADINACDAHKYTPLAEARAGPPSLPSFLSPPYCLPLEYTPLAEALAGLPGRAVLATARRVQCMRCLSHTRSLTPAHP